MGTNEFSDIPQVAGGKGSFTFYLFSLITCVGIALLWRTVPSKPRDEREPHIIAPKIPYIGHLLGMMIHQAEYLRMLAAKTAHPIFSLKVLSGEIYVITSPDLVQAVFKSPKIFSFDKISMDASRKVFALTDRQMKILKQGRKEGDDEDSHPLAIKVAGVMHHTLQTGPALLEMNTRALNCFSGFLDEIEGGEEDEDGMHIKLLGWIRHCFTLATTAALFGDKNPVQDDHSLIQSLLDFEDAIGLLFLDFHPSITAPSGHRARAKYAQAFKSYYHSAQYLNASPIVQGRFATLTAAGMTLDDLASFDIGLMIASTMNSIPAVFWMLTHIYSSPSLLSLLRDEITPHVTLDGKRATLNIPLLATECPLLMSTWNETLRLTDATVSARTVTEDTLLDGKYLLKKGGYVQMACGPMHTSPLIWGSDASRFCASRFTPATQTSLSREDKKQRKAGFAPFGGGTVLCPGRHFAMMEILGVVATLVVGFEISSAYGVALNVPGMKKQGMSVQVKHPVGDLDVVVKRRERWEGVKWGYVFGDEEAGEGVVSD